MATMRRPKPSRKPRIPLHNICLSLVIVIFLLYLGVVYEIHRRHDEKNQSPRTTNHQQYEAPMRTSPAEPMLPEMASSNSRSYQEIIQETTRILYEHSPHLQEWLDRPPLKVYVYDTVPQDWSDLGLISRCIEDKFIEEPYDNCHWDPKQPCNDVRAANSTKENKFMSHRQNYNSDFAYVRWFQEQYPYRTRNAEEADIFVVPYPHWSHCICARDRKHKRPHCSYHNLDLIQEKVLQYLDHYNDDEKKKKQRHLFFLGTDWKLASRDMRQEAQLSLSLGPASGCERQEGNVCGHLVSPYLSTATDYQPSTVNARMMDTAWISETRPFSVGAALGTPPNLHLRREFILNKTAYLGDDVGGLPHQIIDLGSTRQQLRQKDIMGLYVNSTFCPILPGDGCPQKRFFDVLLSGCIPIVPLYEKSAEEGYPSFFGKGSCSIRSTYPFARGAFFGDASAGINYTEMLVTFDGSCGLPCMKGAMETVMNDRVALQRLRHNIRKYAPLFAFGLGTEASQHVDAFAAALVQIRHYIHHLK